jgi:hypothetical protein
MGAGNWVNLGYVWEKVPVLGREESDLGWIFEGEGGVNAGEI